MINVKHGRPKTIRAKLKRLVRDSLRELALVGCERHAIYRWATAGSVALRADRVGERFRLGYEHCGRARKACSEPGPF